MTRAMFFKHFELLADQPDAVAKMRELIRDLGASGRLTPDGAASQKSCTLADVLTSIQTGPFGSSLHKRDYVPNGTPVINPASMVNGKIVPLARMAVDRKTVHRLSTFVLQAGDLVLARRGEMGRAAVVTEAEAGWLCGTGSAILRPSKQVDPNFLQLVISSPRARSYLSAASVGATMSNLNQGVIRKMPMILPPLVEQRRIVAKVDELMALCDQLEQQQTAARELGSKLLDAVLHRLLEERAPV